MNLNVVAAETNVMSLSSDVISRPPAPLLGEGSDSVLDPGRCGR